MVKKKNQAIKLGMYSQKPGRQIDIRAHNQGFHLCTERVHRLFL